MSRPKQNGVLHSRIIDITLMPVSDRYLEFVAGTGDLHQAVTGRGLVAMIVVSPAVAALAAIDVAMRRSQTS